MTATLMPPKLPIALAALATLLLSTPASAAGFNCNYAKLPTEVLICRDSTLSSADDVNARVFYEVRDHVPHWALHVFNVAQRAWIAERNACGWDVECVKSAYQRHVNDLCVRAGDLGLSTCNDDMNLFGETQSQAPAQQGGVSYLIGTIGVDAWDPDPYLALRSEPTTMYGQRLEKMGNGSIVAIIEKQDDGWWFVQDLRSGLQGWAKSGAGWGGLDRAWIHTGVTIPTTFANDGAR